MRVATYNILHGRSTVDGRVDLDRLRTAVTSLDADVLALQEVDRGQQRSGRADLAAIAAQAAGAVDHRFVATMTGAAGQWAPAMDRTDPTLPSYGIALLSRHPVTAWSRLLLPTLPMPAPVWFDKALRPTLVREEPRVALAATVVTPAGPVIVVNVHLSFVPWWNGRQLRMLAGSVRTLGDHPCLLVGDFNMGPAKARRASGMTSLVEAATFPADAPQQQLDHVLAGPGLQAVAAEARQLPLSDHRALVVDVGLGRRR